MRTIIILSAWLCCTAASAENGVPVFRNYSAAEYGAHNRNFDVVVGEDGMVFFANFEGLLCYDNDRWHILHTPGYSRVTRLMKDSKGTVWAAGYNFLVQVQADGKRSLCLHPVVTDTEKNALGEVTGLTEMSGRIRVSNRKGETYEVREGGIVRISSGQPAAGGLPYRTYVEGMGETEINDAVLLRCGWTVIATRQHGIAVLDRQGHRIYSINETDGLCSNNVNGLTESGNGCVWGVTDNGIFCAYIPSMFTRYATEQGLKGEVTTLLRYEGTLYVGTLQGLYREDGVKLHSISGIGQACWKLQQSADGKALYAATTEGVFQVRKNGLRQLTKEYAQSLCSDGTDLYIAEMDCLRRFSPETGKSVRAAEIGKVTELSCDRYGNVTARDIDGKLYRKRKGDTGFRPTETARTGRHVFLDADGTPRWQTGMEGKGIARFPATGKQASGMTDNRLLPLHGLTVRALYTEGDTVLWIGGDYGIVRTDFKAEDAAYSHRPRIFIREVRIDGDSLHFGGVYDPRDWKDGCTNRVPPVFGSGTKEVAFRFSTDGTAALGKTEYQYMLEGYDDGWSAWGEETEKNYANLFYGTYRFKVRARDAFGRISETKVYRFFIGWPFYLQWYSIAAYALLLALAVYLCVKWRLRKLIREKERLEGIVAARTLQIQGQKEEIERKSANLEQALSDLRRAQEDLLRQEKMAAIGKLTRGLIDRILNPLNYINNFSHLSCGLANDLRKNLQDTREKIGAEEYEDSADLLDMLSSNLSKIEQHGSNTSRILKAMEEILKDGNRTKKRTDIAALCRRSVRMLYEYYREDIDRMGISVRTRILGHEVPVEGNEEQLGKTLMSLISNSMYAIAKKYGRETYAPEIEMELTENTEDGTACIRLRDNGTGIEQPILGQVFDPFFTTKTTGEAAGVGLYLSREIIAGHGGDITVASCKGEYTEFTIVLPIIKNETK